MNNERVKSNQIYSVTPRGGMRSSKPSVVEMKIPHRFANDVSILFEDLKEGIEPTGDLVGLELHAKYRWDYDEEQMELPIEDGEPVTGDELVDGKSLELEARAEASRVTASKKTIITTAVKDQDEANEAFQALDDALTGALEE